jgi:AcrR family transcriptional regulator
VVRHAGATKGIPALRKPKNPVQTRAAILSAAIEEFASHGFKGARIDAIARRTKTTSAMIYYYFGGKEKLYLAVLETVYRDIRDSEKALDVEHASPLEGMQRLVAFTLDYYQKNPNFVKIVVAENQAEGRFIRRLPRMPRLNRSVLKSLGDVLGRGEREGLFRQGIVPLDLHMLITSLGWFQIANRHTFGYIFGRDLASPKQIARNQSLILRMVMRFVAANEAVVLPVGKSRKRTQHNGHLSQKELQRVSDATLPAMKGPSRRKSTRKEA